MLALVVVNGMNTSLTVFSPQAAGHGDPRAALVFLRRGQLVLCILFIPILILMLLSGQILLLLGQDEQVCTYANQYNVAFTPAILLFGIRDTTRKFLASVNY